MRPEAITSLALCLVLISALQTFPWAVMAQISCGTTILSDTSLDGDLIECPGDGLVIGSSNVALDCQGHTISGTSRFSGAGIQSVDRLNVTVRNCTVKNFSQGIRFSQTRTSRLLNNTVSGDNVGIFVESSSNNLFASNTISNNGHGFSLAMSNHNSLDSNIASSNIDAFTIEGSSDNTISSNIATANSHGCSLLSSSNNILMSNMASDNSATGISLQSSSHNILETNVAASNDFAGFHLDLASNDNNVTSNQANGNYVGVFLRSSTSNNLSSNTIENGLIGIDIQDSAGNLIFNNLFRNNATNARDTGNNYWNITKIHGPNILNGSFLGGNFWHDYSGTDLSGDDLGDTLLPYTSGGSIANGGDYHPLVPPPTSADLSGRSAWPKHHHLPLAKYASQTLFGKIENFGERPVLARVAFTITDSTGRQVIGLSTGPMMIAVGQTSTLSVEWTTSVTPPLVPGKYRGEATCWFDSDSDGITESTGEKMKNFGFTVVP